MSDLERRVDRRVRKKNRGKKRAEPKRDEETPKPVSAYIVNSHYKLLGWVTKYEYLEL